MPICAHILTQLADVPAQLYYDRGSTHSLATIAGLTLGRIPFYPKAIGTYGSVLNETKAQSHTQIRLARVESKHHVEECLNTASRLACCSFALFGEAATQQQCHGWAH